MLHPSSGPSAANEEASSGDRLFKAAAAFIVLFVVGIFLKIARPVLLPFVLAFFLSYIVDPVLAFLCRKRCPRPWSLAIVLALAFAVLALVGVLVSASLKSLAEELPKYQGRLGEIVRLLQTGWGPIRLDVAETIGRLDIDKVASVILKVVGPFLVFVGKLLLVFLFLIVIVIGKGRGMERLLTALGGSWRDRIATVLDSTDAQIRRYLVIKTGMSLANGVIVWLVLALFGVDFAPLFGALAFVLNFIPDVGSLVATVLRVGFAFFQFGTFWTPFWVLVLTVGLDSILGYFIEPRVMGRGLGLSPLLVFFSLLFWGWLWGVPGMVLSVPLTASAKILCQNVPGLRPLALLME